MYFLPQGTILLYCLVRSPAAVRMTGKASVFPGWKCAGVVRNGTEWQEEKRDVS